MSSGEHQSRVLTEEAMDEAFADLASFDLLFVAVSGGPDSTALMHLVARWVQRRSSRTPDVRVVTIDHRLRPSSSDEARQIAFDATRLGFVHITSFHDPQRHGPSPGGAFSQAWARDLRYRLLREVACERAEGRRAAIVTAHTLDDQAETVLMRLARGSGIDGLGAIRPLRQIEDALWLARPLLGVPKADLKAWLKAHNIAWIEDPSNESHRFERVRLRAGKEARAALGLDDDKLALSAKRARRANAALDAALLRAIGQAGSALVLSPLGLADADRDWLLQLDEELRVRLVMRLIASAGGQGDPVPLGSLEGLLERFSNAGMGKGGFTLAGAQVDPRGARVLIYREPSDARVPLPDVVLSGSGTVMWDNRFTLTSVGFQKDTCAGLTVGPLLPEGVAELEARGWQRPAGCPAQVLWSQPAVRALNVVRWAPTLDFTAMPGEAARFHVVFDWSRLGRDRYS